MRATHRPLLYEKHQISRSFGQAASTYEAAAQLQMHTGAQLLKKLTKLSSPMDYILDIGAGTGYFTQQIAARFPKAQVIGIDIAMGMMHFAAQHHSGKRLSYICADADALPFSTASVDCIYSNLMLQWSSHLPGTLTALKRILQPNGYLGFATLVSGTLFELKAAWGKVDHYPHVHPFPTPESITQMLIHSGYQIHQVQQETVQLTYTNLKDLLLNLKALGAHNLQKNRSKGLSGKKKFKRLAEVYEKFCNDQQRLPATYKVLYGVVQ